VSHAQPEQLLDQSVLSTAKARLRAQLLVDQPIEWAMETLNVHLWSKQIEIIEALETHARVAVRSCHDSGKSFSAAVIAARWLATHPIGQARVITTAPTNTQVRGILWVEINQLHEKGNLPGRVNQTEWWIGSYMAGIGRKPADYKPEGFQGLHARWPLIIVDEAGGVSANLIDAAETLATNVNAKILLIGNPDDPQSPFAAIHADPDKYGYHCIKIAAWDTPNFTAEGPQLLANPSEAAQMLPEVLLSPQWVESRRKAWGEDHPFWQSKVEAEFPAQDSTTICRVGDVIRARIPFNERGASAHDGGMATVGGPPSLATAAIPPTIAANWPPTLGVDVAGSDYGDETVMRLVISNPYPQGVPSGITGNPHTDSEPPPHVVTVGHPDFNNGTPSLLGGLVVSQEWRIRSSDPSILADKIIEAITVAGARRVNIDAIGVGFGVVGMVRERLATLKLDQGSRKVWVKGINSAASANDPRTYGNQRAEMWWLVGRYLFARDMVDTSRADNLEDLEAQLLMPRYRISKGRIFVEAKEDIKARLGRSPDNADALVYAMSSAVVGNSIATIASPPQMSLDPRDTPIGVGHTTNRLVYQQRRAARVLGKVATSTGLLRNR
jgi:hypothetical protein